MWAFLNPLNWIKVLTLLKGVWDVGVSIYSWIAAYLKKRDEEKQIEEIHKIETKIDDANKIEDDQARLKEKQDAACEIDKALDPSHKC